MHGPYVTEDEITAVCDHWRSQAKAVYNERCSKPRKTKAAGPDGEPGGEDVDDDLYQEAVRVVCEAGRASTSTLQRRLRVGYGRAARLIDIMEKDGIVGPPDGTKPREVLKAKDWMREVDQSLRYVGRAGVEPNHGRTGQRRQEHRKRHYPEHGLRPKSYSPLKQINKSNVKRLVPIWNASLMNDQGELAAPTIYNGVMYVVNGKWTFAIDVETGRQIWRTPGAAEPGIQRPRSTRRGDHL
jgi:hypothetical protein